MPFGIQSDFLEMYMDILKTRLPKSRVPDSLRSIYLRIGLETIDLGRCYQKGVGHSVQLTIQELFNCFQISKPLAVWILCMNKYFSF